MRGWESVQSRRCRCDPGGDPGGDVWGEARVSQQNGERGGGGGVQTQSRRPQRGMFRKHDEGSGQERLSLEDKGWSDSRGTWNVTLGSPGLRWAPLEACEGGRPRPSSESEDICGGGTTEEARHEAEDHAGTHCRHSGERCPGREPRSKSSKGEQGCGAAQKVKPVGLRPDVGQ